MLHNIACFRNTIEAFASGTSYTGRLLPNHKYFLTCGWCGWGGREQEDNVDQNTSSINFKPYEYCKTTLQPHRAFLQSCAIRSPSAWVQTSREKGLYSCLCSYNFSFTTTGPEYINQALLRVSAITILPSPHMSSFLMPSRRFVAIYIYI